MGLYLSFLFLSDFFASFVPCITLLMTVDIASYLINSSDTDSSFHDLDCHVCFSGVRKKRMQLRFRWYVPLFP